MGATTGTVGVTRRLPHLALAVNRAAGLAFRDLDTA